MEQLLFQALYVAIIRKYEQFVSTTHNENKKILTEQIKKYTIKQTTISTQRKQNKKTLALF